MNTIIIDRRVHSGHEVLRIFDARVHQYITDSLEPEVLVQAVLKQSMDNHLQEIVRELPTILSRVNNTNSSVRETGKTPDDAPWRDEDPATDPMTDNRVFMLVRADGPVLLGITTEQLTKQLGENLGITAASEILRWADTAPIGDVWCKGGTQVVRLIDVYGITGKPQVR
jgi:hypothetical protein